MSGADLRMVQVLGGWKKLAMVERYSHLSPRHKNQAIERIAEEFHNAIHNTPKGEIQQLAISG